MEKIVSVRNNEERIEIHMRENSEDGGLLIVAEKPQQLTIVNIADKINIDQLSQLQGHMGVPAMSGIVGNAVPVLPATKADSVTPAPAAHEATRP